MQLELAFSLKFSNEVLATLTYGTPQEITKDVDVKILKRHL